MLQLFNCVAPSNAIVKKLILKKMQYRACIIKCVENIVGVYKYLYCAF